MWHGIRIYLVWTIFRVNELYIGPKVEAFGGIKFTILGLWDIPIGAFILMAIPLWLAFAPDRSFRIDFWRQRLSWCRRTLSACQKLRHTIKPSGLNPPSTHFSQNT